MIFKTKKIKANDILESIIVQLFKKEIIVLFLFLIQLYHPKEIYPQQNELYLNDFYEQNNIECGYDVDEKMIITKLKTSDQLFYSPDVTFTFDYAMFYPMVLKTLPVGAHTTKLEVKIIDFENVTSVVASGSIYKVDGVEVTEFELYDDGTHGDQSANDGKWTRDNISVKAAYSGTSLVSITITETGGLNQVNNSSLLFLHTQDIPMPSINYVNSITQYSEYVVNIKDDGTILSWLNPQNITNVFYQWYSDIYDFITIFPQPWPSHFPPNIAGIHNNVKNDIEGIGLSIFDNTADYGSDLGILKGVTYCQNFQVDIHEKLHQFQVWLDPTLNLNNGAHWNQYVNFEGFFDFGGGGLFYRKLDETTFVRERHDGIYKSSDSGTNWFESNKGAFAINFKSTPFIYFLEINPSSPNEVFIGGYKIDYSGGIFKSTDNGDTWAAKNNGIPGTSSSSSSRIMQDFAFDPQNSNISYTSSTKFFKSTDGGENWEILYDHSFSPIHSIAIDPQSSDIMYFTSSFGYLSKSTDGGINWSIYMSTLGNEVSTLIIDPLNSNILYGSTKGSGIKKSVDGGLNWSAVNTGLVDLNVNTLEFDPTDNQVLFSGTNDGLFKSTNGGTNWTELSGAVNLENIQVISIDPSNTSIIYIGCGIIGNKTGSAWGNLFKTTDGGQNFELIDLGLDHPSITAIAINPNEQSSVLCGTIEPLLYSKLELYLMGLVPSEDVPPTLVVTDPTPDPFTLYSGETFSVSSYSTVSVDDIINVEGPRIPNYQNSQKLWKLAHVVVSRDRLLNASEMAYFNNIGKYYGSNATSDLHFNELKSFEAATGYRMDMETEIFSEPSAFVKFSGKIFLEGCYSSGLMTTDLLGGDHLPLSQSYVSSPWNYFGTENISFFPPNFVDWVLIELRDKTDPTLIISTRAGLLLNNGDIVDLNGMSPLQFPVPEDDYYIVAIHRNHCSIMSSIPVSLNSSTTVLYDFTTSQMQAYGTNAMVNLGAGDYGMYSGDASKDGQIDADDRAATWNERNLVGYKDTDVTMDGQVDADDRATTWNNRNIVSQVPAAIPVMSKKINYHNNINK